MNYILNGAQIENMATQLNKANRTAIRQCECEKIAEENKRLRELLKETIDEEIGLADKIKQLRDALDKVWALAEEMWTFGADMGGVESIRRVLEKALESES